MKPKPIPQYELPQMRDAFNLFSETTMDGERAKREKQQREADRKQSAQQQTHLIQL